MVVEFTMVVIIVENVNFLEVIKSSLMISAFQFCNGEWEGKTMVRRHLFHRTKMKKNTSFLLTAAIVLVSVTRTRTGELIKQLANLLRVGVA